MVLTLLLFTLIVVIVIKLFGYEKTTKFLPIIANIEIIEKVPFSNNYVPVNKSPPGPKPWPIIGNLNVFAKYEIPFEAFTALAKQYGKVYSLRLGSVPCVVVNSLDVIKEVLISKANDFGGRPDFIRYHKLFGGDRNNSLALCDWSQLQRTRRSIARTFCSPRFTSTYYDTFNEICCNEIEFMLDEITARFQNNENGSEKIKPLLLQTSANMFLRYMCGEKFDYHNQEFQVIVQRFDEIFFEINQCYALDFLPWLQPVYETHLRNIRQWATDIRKFIYFEIIEKRIKNIELNNEPNDFTDALLLLLENDDTVNLQHILFELEDFIGGHSAIGNLVMIMINEIVKNPETVRKIQEEIDTVTNETRRVNLFDKVNMPYTESIIFETLRVSSSPIVPHVATTDTHIKNYNIPKGTVVFLNNYDLNTNSDYWDQPNSFKPERFISPATQKIVKPTHFIPFSTGKRTCIGQKLVQGCAFLIVASIFQNFNVSIPKNQHNRTTPCCMALPIDCFSFNFTKRLRASN